MKMIKIETTVPELDRENANLMIASEILEQLSNAPGVTLTDFQQVLLLKDIPFEEHEDLLLAAISIETMMSLDSVIPVHEEPTIH